MHTLYTSLQNRCSKAGVFSDYCKRLKDPHLRPLCGQPPMCLFFHRTTAHLSVLHTGGLGGAVRTHRLQLHLLRYHTAASPGKVSHHLRVSVPVAEGPVWWSRVMVQPHGSGLRCSRTLVYNLSCTFGSKCCIACIACVHSINCHWYKIWSVQYWR